MRTTERNRGRGAVRLVDWFRSQLSPTARRRVRALTDPLSGPLGSIRAVRTSAQAVALTFDDGPDPTHTPGILDVLARHNAKATWFVLVERAESRPDLIERIVREGHDVALHGLDHRRLTRLARKDLPDHIASGARRLAAISGRQPRFFRPPYGSQNLASFLAVRRHGMESVVWTADCDDWSQHPEEHIAKRAIEASVPGAIILLHDSLAADPLVPAPQAKLDRTFLVDLVMQGLASRGLQSQSLSELLHHGDAHRTMWFRP